MPRQYANDDTFIHSIPLYDDNEDEVRGTHYLQHGKDV